VQALRLRIRRLVDLREIEHKSHAAGKFGEDGLQPALRRNPETFSEAIFYLPILNFELNVAIMNPGSPNYLPLAPPSFGLLAFILLVLVLVIEFRAFRYAYERIGLSSRAAFLLLLASLIGSYFNIPLVQLPARQIITRGEVQFFGMVHVIPVAVEWPGTLIAINVGGAVVPIVVSGYLLVTRRLWLKGAIAIACVTVVCHLLAYPVPGLGIAMPVIVPPIAAAVVALVLSRRDAARLAYIGGTLGALIGADLLNLGRVQSLGAPIASIGGAGTFDGVFLTGIVAVLLASLITPPRSGDRSPGKQAARDQS
jgi:uncharacterized membrane protein